MSREDRQIYDRRGHRQQERVSSWKRDGGGDGGDHRRQGSRRRPSSKRSWERSNRHYDSYDHANTSNGINGWSAKRRRQSPDQQQRDYHQQREPAWGDYPSARRDRTRSRSRDRYPSREQQQHQHKRQRDSRRARNGSGSSGGSSSRGGGGGSGGGRRGQGNGGGGGGGGGDDEGHYEGQSGSVLGDGYEVQEDVGTGTFGRVVACWDRRGRRTVAVKVVRRVKRYHESALIEADILRDVNRAGGAGAALCVRLLDQFDARGHCCLVFERMGPSLYDVLKRNDYRGFPLRYVRDFARQLLEAVAFLHSMGLVHTDLKPENVLLCDLELEPERGRYKDDQDALMLPVSTRIKVIDFGGATYVDDHKSATVNTRQYRAPEVILGVGWCRPSDLWSCGCIVAELYQGELLFATHDNMEHLALMERCVGPFPRHMVRASPVGAKYFDSRGVSRWRRACPEDSRAHIRRMPTIEELVAQDEPSGLGGLLEGILELDPDKRLRASDALRHRFFAAPPPAQQQQQQQPAHRK
ncbi:kinase-like domain-containing protein [Tribonema minus]|uniref:Kinase-like domain-containing protein n=1 Tax=Tribonema minus TaxID=303371 RepID=A0A835Z1U5_9STRA|nr:kinase-like domain-containing protein [Tribonema minus]